MNALGRHILAEFYGCDANILNDSQMIEAYMKQAALECGATIVSSTFHTFNPHGVSGVVVIAESHLAIHTWPEYGYAAVDVFTCGETVDPTVANDSLKESLQAEKVKVMELKRGELSSNKVLPHKPVIAE
ncbi:MAG: adenosylmethionine decarboxylase [Calditrichia bacterium]|nr:S-adenosylmethionine decarboxylase proenzyme [Calditrichota bacterium]MCB0267250.1 S-adenosylmethionine decarboxylase proenzyme [Calditrichota bacterium]MCB0285892.1 S-adenosylmethionine decarboxylase proenzyme [Calditrichota bacterium]MCB9068813.1 S-adenosylmethionine decarboxylase proenzyme [Calditrichia bacterium]